MVNYASTSRRLSKTLNSSHALSRRRSSIAVPHPRASSSGRATCLHLLANTALLTTDVIEGASILASIKGSNPREHSHPPRKSSLCFPCATPPYHLQPQIAPSYPLSRLVHRKSLSLPRIPHPAKSSVDVALSSHSPKSPPRKRAALDATAESTKDIRRKNVLCGDRAIVAGSVQPRQVTCRGCRETRQLENRGKYYPHNWWKHKAKCAGLRELLKAGELREEEWHYRG